MRGTVPKEKEIGQVGGHPINPSTTHGGSSGEHKATHNPTQTILIEHKNKKLTLFV